MTTYEAAGQRAVGKDSPARVVEALHAETIALRARIEELELERDEARSEVEGYAASSVMVTEVADRCVSRWRDEEDGLRASLAAAHGEIARLQQQLDADHLEQTRDSGASEALRRDNDLMASWLKEIEGSRAWRAVTAYRLVRTLFLRRR